MPNLVIIAINVNGTSLETKKNETSQCYISFLKFCFENFSERLAESEYLCKIFKTDPNYPYFSQATINYKRVRNHNGFYFHTYQDSADKREIIENVTNELGLQIELTFG